MRVAIIDDDAFARDAMKTLLGRVDGITVSWTAGTASEALARLNQDETAQPQVFLVDISMPGMNGIELVRRLHVLSPTSAVIMISVLTRADKIREAFRAGATGYFVKEDDPAQIAENLGKALAGELVFSPTCSRQLISVLTDDAALVAVKRHAGEPSDTVLTPREKEILTLMSESRTNSQIASRLKISENTVKTHIKSILQKCDAADRAGAVAHGIRQGIID